MSDSRGISRAGKTEMKYHDEQKVQKHIGQPGDNGNDETELWFFGSCKETLKHILQNEKRLRYKENSAVYNAVVYHVVAGTKCNGNGTHKDKADDGQCNTERDGNINQHGKITVCQFLFSFAECFCNNGASAGAEHHADTADTHENGHDEIDGGKRCFTDEIGNKNAVNDAIE